MTSRGEVLVKLCNREFREISEMGKEEFNPLFDLLELGVSILRVLVS